MTVKLNVDIEKGTLDVEGDADLVREVYKDLKDQLFPAFKERASGAAAKSVNPTASQHPSASDGAENGPHRSRRRKAAVDNGGGKKVGVYTPKLDGSLNLSELDAYYSQYAPKNNYERILIFVEFLRTKLNLEPCSADAIFTCFHKLRAKIKTPTAFAQALIDSRGKFAYISYEAYDQITLTTAGENHLYHDLEKASAE